MKIHWYAVMAGLICSLAVQAETFQDDQLTPKAMEAIWAGFIDIDDEGATRAFNDMRRMIQAPKVSVPFLKARLKPAPSADAKAIAKYIMDLDSKSFAAREKAMQALRKIGAPAGPMLVKKLKTMPPLEMRRRLEMLLAHIDEQPLTADELRSLRGIEVLQGIANTEAKSVLQALAKGGPGSIITEQAKQALANIAGRTASK